MKQQKRFDVISLPWIEMKLGYEFCIVHCLFLFLIKTKIIKFLKITLSIAFLLHPTTKVKKI